MKATGGESKSADESEMEQYELTEDEDEPEAKDVARVDAAKRGKRKRSRTHKDEDELARRRRRRRSLGFQPKRRSLTATERKATAVGASGSTTAGPHSKQYISDMYSTIIKMSSENVGSCHSCEGVRNVN